MVVFDVQELILIIGSHILFCNAVIILYHHIVCYCVVIFRPCSPLHDMKLHQKHFNGQ